MSKGPGLFSDFGKKTKYVLTKDYSSDQKLTVFTQSKDGLALVSTAAVKKGRLSYGDVATQYKYKNATVHVKIDTESNISTTLAVRHFLLSTKKNASCKLPDYDSDKTQVSTAVKQQGLSGDVTAQSKGLSGDASAKYKYKNAMVDVNIDTKLNISTTLAVTDILPSTKTVAASSKLPNYNAVKVGIRYFHEHANFIIAFGLNKSPTVDFSATMGTRTIAFGTEISYMVVSRSFTKYNAGISLTTRDFYASAILADKGDTLRVSYFHHLDRLKKGAIVGEISRKFLTNENTSTVGCSYAIYPHTTVKAKLNNYGNLGTLIQHELKPNSFLTISGSFDTKAMKKIPKFGLTLSLKR